MGQEFDEKTLQTIKAVASLVTSIVAAFSLYGRFVVLPRLQAITGNKHVPNLRSQVGYTLAWMILCTAILVYPITLLTNDQESLQEEFSSSINFCEADFVHSPWIAEPVNTVSNLFAYLPPAVIGFLKTDKLRFQICYVALFSIGVGSTLLHSCLTAMTQGGDELPMLWYTAAASYCGFCVLFDSHKLVAPIVVASAIIATTVYVQFRDTFIVFALMFNAYVIVLILSLVHITLFKKWSSSSTTTTDDNKTDLMENGNNNNVDSDPKRTAAEFQQCVLYPLGQAAAWTAISATWFWMAEMVYCNMISPNSGVIFFLWDKCWHPMWHYMTGNLALLVVQIFYAADGYAKEKQMPRIVWYCGVVLVVYDNEEGLGLLKNNKNEQQGLKRSRTRSV